MASKILIVEDDLNLLATLKYNLVKEGHEVLTTVDGAQALEVARREKTDLLVLDIMLPKLSGFEVCRILRKETNVPILMLTAKVEKVDKIVGLEIGADVQRWPIFDKVDYNETLNANLKVLPIVQCRPL
jgi:DNA-binding response OmpR family regulator